MMGRLVIVASFFVSLLNELKSLLGKLGGWLTKLGGRLTKLGDLVSILGGRLTKPGDLVSILGGRLTKLRGLVSILGGWRTKLGVLLIVTCWFWMNCYFDYSPGMENFRRTMHLQLRPIVPEILICLFSRQIRLEGKAG